MSNVYSLNTLKNDLDKEFAPLQLDVEGETLTLRNLMRIDDKARDLVLAELEKIDASAGDGEEEEQSIEDVSAMSAALTTVIRTVTANNKGDKLVAHIDGDLMLGMKIIELWTEATQPGEAQNSPA